MTDRYDEPPCCRLCGREKEWEDCERGCDDGYVDEGDEDPVNYAEGESYRKCDWCRGRGGYWICPREPHEEDPKTGEMRCST